MGNALFDAGKEALLSGGIDLTSDDINVAVVDLDDIGDGVEAASNASPIVITATGHGFSNGQRVLITGVEGNTAANGVFTVANVATDTFELAGSTGNGAYTSGGRILNLTTHEDLADISAGVVAEADAFLSGITIDQGVFDANDADFTGLTGDPVEAVVVFLDTGTAGTSILIAVFTQGTNLPATPNGGDLTVQWHASGLFAI